ncbi:plasma-membrane proton-efflux P-type ATPase [Caldisericum exile]|uniref:Cation-transporting ATPase n=1 Tax=Caldisericum exile (strain DSM 21853 / NBRC 104410 / AZM16c01) TaxID=511051 RepID=A0A7U6GD74_CALEA|nr:plasma-membrane proton-efflux P-type ATPase [Caldisericum exile]BAL80267.1 putative cation-transporting ATPase [Caldisericum exile AZM16c01]
MVYKGLTTEEAQKLQKEYGFNEIKQKETSPFLDFLKRFTGLTAFVIEGAMIISLLIGSYIDAVVMLFLLLLNAILGFSEEFRASKAVEALSKKISVNAHVLRDGVFKEIPAKELVPGDVIKIAMGDIVPADCKIVEGNILVDQSVLTGESIPKECSVNDEIYSGSLITRGSAIASVEKTGAKTYFGKTAELIEKAKPKLIIEEITMSVTRGLLVVDALFIGAVILKFVIQKSPLLDTLPFILTLLIASIPVALPAMTVLALSLGSLQLASVGVLVRKLDGIENSAMMDVLCLDKTGTITENKIRIVDVVVMNPKFTEEDVVEFAYLSSDSVTKDPIDSAVIEFGKDKVKGLYKLVRFRPFDPDKKYSDGEILDKDGNTLNVYKGAPQVILGMSSNIDSSINATVEKFASVGKRSLGVAVKKGNEITFVGLLTFFDYPREDSKKFIQKIKEMGVRPVMITGDNKLIAQSVAKDVGIGENVLSIKELKENERIDIESIDSFAEVIPEDKFNIVDIYQKKGHTVGMTGDGANDAPALKKADLGIAVKDALDIAKQSAKVILTEVCLSNIVNLITVGRQIYRRIILWILNKIVKTFQIVFFVSIATLIMGKPIITPVAMVLMLFLYDFVTMSIATDNVVPSNRPEKWNIKKLLSMSLIFGVLKISELFVAMYLAQKFFKITFSELQTLMFYLLLVSGLFNILNFREERFFFSSLPSKVIIISITGDIIVATLISTFGIFVSKAHFGLLMITLLYAILVTLVFTDIIKLFVYRWFKF